MSGKLTVDQLAHQVGRGCHTITLTSGKSVRGMVTLVSEDIPAADTVVELDMLDPARCSCSMHGFRADCGVSDPAPWNTVRAHYGLPPLRQSTVTNYCRRCDLVCLGEYPLTLLFSEIREINP